MTQTFPTDWDLDYYKTDYESEEHWELRRTFMEKHMDQFPEDELVCLAQVFTNVEFMGCRYPEETMRRVAMLSKDVAADFRKKRATKLKRTFVGASDAAEAKAKKGSSGGSSTSSFSAKNTKPNYLKPVQFTPSSQEPVEKNDVPFGISQPKRSAVTKMKDNDDLEARPSYPPKIPSLLDISCFSQSKSSTVTRLQDEDDLEVRPSFNTNPFQPSTQPLKIPSLLDMTCFDQQSTRNRKQSAKNQKKQNVNPALPERAIQINTFNRKTKLNEQFSQSHSQQQQLAPNKFKNFIIFEAENHKNQSNFEKITLSGQKQKVIPVFEFANLNANQTECTVSINGIVTGKGQADSKKAAREVACEDAINNLKKECYTLQCKDKKIANKIQINANQQTRHNQSKSEKQLKQGTSFTDNKLNEDNKGFKMMKLLGWSGGALASGGIEEPIGVQLKVDRQGLGLKSADVANHTELNHKYFMNYLQDYRNDMNNIQELVFSKDFTKEERAKLHGFAAKFGLKSKSRDTPDGDRFLIISKNIQLEILARNVLNDGIYTELYDLIQPTNLMV